MEDNVKQALLDGSATIQTKIEIITDDNEENIILDEQNGVVSWDYEDFRYVKDEGWIGQFVARQVNGVVKNISDDFSMTNKEFILHIGVKIGDNTTWYSLGNFLVNKVTDDEVNDKTSFEALDYTKKFNQTYVDSITYPCTALELAQNVCEQCDCELGNTDFKHNDWEITGNVFTNGESCREVLKAIGKLAYSWVRVDWNNKVYIDFIKKTEVNEYNEINNSNYYSLTTQKEKFGAINRVIIGYKDIEGERTKVEDIEDIETNGVNEITIYDNPLVYNQELREEAIVGAEDLFGLEYLPLETLTVGHPWLKGDELVEVTNMEGKVHKTIPFDRTIQYFGHIKTKINVATNTKTNTEYAYESGIGGRFRKTEIMVDKINGQITEVIEEQEETTEKLNETISTVDETKQTISSVETTVQDITTTTQISTGGNSLYITDALESNALEYHIEGKSEQDGTPTPDAPVEIKTIPSIRNLFDKDNITLLNCYINTDGTLTAATNWIVTSSYIKVKPNTEYIVSAKNLGTRFVYAEHTSEDVTTIVGQRKEITPKTSFITSETTNYIRFCTNNPDATDFQLEEGSIIHSYVPYGSWLKTKITGKNLIKQPYLQNDKTTLGITFKTNADYTVNVNGTSTGNAIFYITKDDWNYNSRLLPTFKAGTYTFKATGNSNVELVFNTYKQDGTNEYTRVSTQDVVKTFTEDVKLNIRLLVSNGKSANNVNVPIQVEKGTVATEYEEYKEKEVLIDLNKSNLFDKNTITPNYRLGSDGLPYANNGYFLSDFISVDSLTEYTYERLANNISEAICYYDENKNFISRTTNLRKDVYIFKTTETTKYIRIADSIDSVDISKLYEGYTDYYELSSIGDTKDTLDIVNGQVVIDKKIDKVIFDGSATWSKRTDIPNLINTSCFRTAYSDEVKNNALQNTAQLSDKFVCLNNTTDVEHIRYTGASDYRFQIFIDKSRLTSDDSTGFKTWLSENNTTVYYILAESQQITLPNTNIELFEGVNYITLVDDLETTTSIKYYRNTPIAQDYVVQQQLDKTNNELNNTTSKTNENTLNINATNTNLNNNYYTKPQIDVMNTSTTQEITTIKKEVETKVTAEDLTIAINQIKTTSASSVETTTGYKFDENGLSIKKSDSQMSSLLDNDGLVVKRDTTEVLTVRSSGVQTENLTVRTYFTIGDNTRAENYKGGTGFFYIGGDN